MQLRGEKHEAQEAANSVISIVNLADQALREAQCEGLFRLSLAQMEQKLFMTKSKLATAIKSLEKISLRRKLISEFKIQTKSYSIAQHNASSRNILLR
jgi:rhamnose utilization protein RhaD (predicted bifunctional aldolase and dehydrogenase)